MRLLKKGECKRRSKGACERRETGRKKKVERVGVTLKIIQIR